MEFGLPALRAGGGGIKLIGILITLRGVRCDAVSNSKRFLQNGLLCCVARAGSIGVSFTSNNDARIHGLRLRGWANKQTRSSAEKERT